MAEFLNKIIPNVMARTDIFWEIAEESILPEETRKPSRGSPNTVILASSFQSGCAMMPTEYPCACSNLVIMACPKEG